MRSDLAEELLHELMGWDRAAFADRVRRLEAMATYKWDEYGNFRPGIRFFESLAAWLDQFDDPTDRATALEFVLDRLVFISDAEMTHLIELVYPDHIEGVLLQRVSNQTGIPRHRVRELIDHPLFASLRRRSLILGASDGARLDRLRRSAPFLSHEQFLQGSEPPPDLVKPMCTELAKALKKIDAEAPATFSHVFLVDDFAGSGKTMLRIENDEAKGKLAKLHAALVELQKAECVADDADVTAVIYVASEQARDHLATTLPLSDLPPWDVRVVQTLPNALRVDRTDPAFAALAERMYDEVLTDDHKGRAPLGFTNCALPVVLGHNTPNNSVSLLWADTTQEPEGAGRRALFPRYERHHRDRP